MPAERRTCARRPVLSLLSVVLILLLAAPASLAEDDAPVESGRPHRETDLPRSTFSPRTRAILDTLRPDPADLARTYPERFDWREHDGVTPLRDQSFCGSCWAFAATAEVEANIRIAEGLSLDLSEQQGVDCNTGGSSCNGGWPGDVYELFMNIGAVTEECFPYIAVDGPCRQRVCDKVAFVDGHDYIAGNMNSYKAAILEGPITTCDSSHCVCMIGWDDAIGKWITKDSAGAQWTYYGYGSGMSNGAVRSVNPHTPTDRFVPDEYPTIQAAVDGAERGDVIKVAEGVYPETVTVPGTLTLAGGYDSTFTVRDPVSHPTVIDAGGGSYGLVLGEQYDGTKNVTIDGFVITGASTAGVHVWSGEARLGNLDVHGCGRGVVVATRAWGDDGRVMIESSTVHDNAGDGLHVDNLSYDDLIVSLSAVYDNGGHGILAEDSPVAVLNCTVAGNGGDGIRIEGGSVSVLTSSIVALNVEYGVRVVASSLEIGHSDVWGNAAGDLLGCTAGPGCLSEDPIFCDPGSSDYRLHSTSPCAGAGDFGQNMGAFGIGCPPGPGDLEIAQEGASLVLSWSPPPAEVVVDHYVVYRDTMWMYTVPIATVSAAETTFVDITIPPCVPHDYCIAAVDTGGLEGALTAEVAAELCYAGPTDLIAAFDVDGNELAWNLAEGAVEYQVIVRSSGAAPPDSIGWVPPSVTTFLDEATADCVRDNYTYEILPVYDTAWRGLPSVGATVDPAPSPPFGLAAAWSGDDVVLSWAPNCESDFRRYWVYRDTIPFPMPLNSNLLVGFTADTTFVDAGLDPERVYFYRLAASDFSAQKSRYSDLAYLGEGEVLTVPSPYGSIQEALNAASALDTVVVGPGTYDENVTLKDAVTLVGLEGAEGTTIRGGSGAIVTAGVLVELTVLRGFTIDGLGTANVGLNSWGSSLRVEDCVFRNASVGADFRFGGSARLSANVFVMNEVGVACSDSAAPFLSGNTFDGNALSGVLTTGAPGARIGGSLDDANDFVNPGTFQVVNSGIDETHADHNYWGNVCVESAWFQGPVDYVPWTDAEHAAVYYECPTSVDDGAVFEAAASYNYPNPFNPSTTIRYTVTDGGGRARLTIYDLAGRKVRMLVDEDAAAGRHFAVWRGRDDRGREVAPGVYFYRYEIGAKSIERKMVLLK